MPGQVYENTERILAKVKATTAYAAVCSASFEKMTAGVHAPYATPDKLTPDEVGRYLITLMTGEQNVKKTAIYKFEAANHNGFDFVVSVFFV